MMPGKRKRGDKDVTTRHNSVGHDPTIATKSLDSLREKRVSLLKGRQALPIWSDAETIRQHLRDKDILLLVGETGSGKSTQVPQFLVDEPWCKHGCIAITQPRRVAAISLARRVAEEMGTPLGSASPASKVGYSVRFDRSVSKSTKIKFLTEGMLLQEMLQDPSLSQYRAVIIDEVHERSENVDLILGFLRNLVTGATSARKHKPLKIVVMSATADIEALTTFFDDGFVAVGASPVHERQAGDNLERPEVDESTNGQRAAHDSATTTMETTQSSHINTCRIKGRQYPVSLSYLPEATNTYSEAALKIVFQLHHKEAIPGDILVFMPGKDAIDDLIRMINQYAITLPKSLPKIQTLPLYAALPQSMQQEIFTRPPRNTRKVIVSTNIAETSVTVPGVRFVIDSGKAKVRQFRSRTGFESLLVKPVSQSSAIQRQGRAGREAAGKCFRLYTEKAYRELEANSTPEILRCDLSKAVLTLKARGVVDVIGFPLLSPPPRPAIEQALLQLLRLGAIDAKGDITPIGKTMASLPLNPPLSRCLIEAAQPQHACLAEMIDIVAALSVETIFLPTDTDEKRELAESARRALYRRDGDHLTMMAAVQSYSAEQSDRKAWAERHLVSHRAMQNVMDVRKQLTAQCEALGIAVDASAPAASNDPEARNATILQCLLRGFATNTARLTPSGAYHTLVGNLPVAIHPSSVLFGNRKVEAIVFSEFVYTTKSYARCVSAVRLAWVTEAF